ncbi:MAG: ATP-grasp domain-containing protein, partial [Chloroflexota bacterium]
PGAIILGGHFHSLGAVRNLAKHGVPVCVLDSGICVAQFSRHVRSFHRCPPTTDERELIGFLLQLAVEEKLSGWVLFPSTDEWVRILAQHRECLSQHYHVTTAPWEVIRFAYDKRLTHRLAIERGVPVPWTHSPGSLDDLASLNLEFPVVLKPAITSKFLPFTRKKAYRANTMEELIRLYGVMAAIIDPSEILIQELIPGRAENLFSFAGFFRNGVPIAGLAARRPRQHPMEFGRASTLVETVDLPELKALAIQLLQGIAYSGLAEVEFMYDPKHARFELLEVNPRLWGWHTIATRAGLDLPYLVFADAIGREVTMGPVRHGVKWVRLVTDTPTAAQEILTGRLTVQEYLASVAGEMEFAVFSVHDPLPFLADVFLIPYYGIKRGF